MGGTLRNEGDKPVARGYLVILPITARCEPGHFVFYEFGELPPVSTHEFRIPITDRLIAYRLTGSQARGLWAIWGMLCRYGTRQKPLLLPDMKRKKVYAGTKGDNRMNASNKRTDTGQPSETRVHVDAPVLSPWPDILARFRSKESVERLIWKKMRELEPEEFVIFMEAAEERLEELTQEIVGNVDLL